MSAVDLIKTLVGGFYGFSPDALESRSRYEPLTTARMVAIALAHEMTDTDQTALGRQFNRAHSLISYAVQTVKNRTETERVFAAVVSGLRDLCEAEIIKLNRQKLESLSA